jgi:hypothetical protein
MVVVVLRALFVVLLLAVAGAEELTPLKLDNLENELNGSWYESLWKTRSQQ